MTQRLQELLGRASGLISFANRLAPLGFSRIDRAKIRAHVLLLPALQRVNAGNVRLRLAIAPSGFMVRDRSDYIVLEETLITNDFDLDFGELRTVVDLGAHAGAFTIKLRSLFPAARFVCVEPSKPTYERLIANVGHFLNVETVNAAVSDTDGYATFQDEPLSWGSHLSEAGDRTVQTFTLSTLRERYELPEIDLLKIDIEGAEWDVLRSESDLIGVARVLGELHGGTPERFFARFGSFHGQDIKDFGHGRLIHLQRH